LISKYIAQEKIQWFKNWREKLGIVFYRLFSFFDFDIKNRDDIIPEEAYNLPFCSYPASAYGRSALPLLIRTTPAQHQRTTHFQVLHLFGTVLPYFLLRAKLLPYGLS
jgi:hypothetical protein